MPVRLWELLLSIIMHKTIKPITYYLKKVFSRRNLAYRSRHHIRNHRAHWASLNHSRCHYKHGRFENSSTWTTSTHKLYMPLFLGDNSSFNYYLFLVFIMQFG